MGILKINNKLFKYHNHLCRFAGSPGPEPVFPYVQIGNQIWMSENLSIDDGETGIYHENTFGYDFGVQYYYTLEAAARVAHSIDGWHLPTLSDFETLKNYLMSNLGTEEIAPVLKSTYGWTYRNGTDEYGFTWLPVGRSQNDMVHSVGTEAYLWSSTEDVNVPGNYKTFEAYAWSDYTTLGSQEPTYQLSVRLIKDND